MSSPWGNEEKSQWLEEQSIQRSYQKEVINKLDDYDGPLVKKQYGALSFETERYPLFLFHSKNFSNGLKTVLITGGVHGYETSGVQGAIRILDEVVSKYSDKFNFIIAPCISPWGYETINRWNPFAIDPNRSFHKDGPCEESNQVMKAVLDLSNDIYAHFDLHETTDTDNTVFRPALGLRDGKEQDIWDIPDGFYLVGDTQNPCEGFQKAIIDSVREVTHIAPADSEGRIIGELITQEGVINYPVKKVSLCTSFSNARYNTTTEVYPDSDKVNDEDCVLAQVAAVVGGLNYLLKQ